MIEFLTKEELTAIVGTKYRYLQIEWLEENDWPHALDFKGNPVVLRSLALEKLGKKSPSTGWRLDPAKIR